MIPGLNLPQARSEKIHSPSTYEVRLAYIPVKSGENGITDLSRADKDGVVTLKDGSEFYFDGTDICIVGRDGNRRHVAVVSELLKPDMDLDSHEQGVSYRVTGTDLLPLQRKVENGAYSILFALENGNSREGYSPLENLANILPTVSRVPSINEAVDRYGLFEVAYTVTGGHWGAQKREAVESLLLKSGLDKDKVDSALKIYDIYTSGASQFEGYAFAALLARPTELERRFSSLFEMAKELPPQYQKNMRNNLAYLIFSEKIMQGGGIANGNEPGEREHVTLKEIREALIPFGLERHFFGYRKCEESLQKTKHALIKKPFRDFTEILGSDDTSPIKLARILDAASHDIRLHTEYFNPLENFYIIGPDELKISEIAGLTEEEFEEARKTWGLYNEMHRKVFDALQAIRMAGGYKTLKSGAEGSDDPFRPDAASRPKETDLTLVGQRKHNENRILEIFYEHTGLDPDRYPVYVAAIRNPHFSMDDVQTMIENCRDDYYVKEAVNAKVRQLENREVDSPTDNMQTRIRLHVLWNLPQYQELCKDLVKKAIEYAKDKQFSYREQVWFRHYGGAIKKEFPEILYRFMEQLILEKAKKETGGAVLLENLVEQYGDILYYGLGMDQQGAQDGRPVHRRKQFAEAYIAAKFCLDPGLLGGRMVHEDFERSVMMEDAKWLDELADRGIQSKLDELLFKYLYPNVEGLATDVKKLVKDTKSVDVIGDVLTKMNASWGLCDEDDFSNFYNAKETLDGLDRELYPMIISQQIKFAQGGEEPNEWDIYMAAVYRTMSRMIERYSGDPEEIISAVEGDIKQLLQDSDKKERLQSQAAQLTLMLQELGVTLTTGYAPVGYAPVPGFFGGEIKDEHEMTKLMLDFLPKIVMSVPEIRAHYIYNKIKEEVEKIEKPKEDDNISLGEGDFF